MTESAELIKPGHGHRRYKRWDHNVQNRAYERPKAFRVLKSPIVEGGIKQEIKHQLTRHFVRSSLKSRSASQPNIKEPIRQSEVSPYL